MTLNDHYSRIIESDQSNDGLKLSCDKLFQFLKEQKYGNINNDIKLTRVEILDKFDGDNDKIIQVLRGQIVFYFQFYSFLVSEYDKNLTESEESELLEWMRGILETLELRIGTDDFQIFFENFLISNFKKTMKSLLYELCEMLGLESPEDIRPDNYEEDKDEYIVPKFSTDKNKSEKVKAEPILIASTSNVISTHSVRGSLGVVGSQKHFEIFDNNLMSTRAAMIKKDRKKTPIKSKKSLSVDKKKKRRCLAKDTPNREKGKPPRFLRAPIAAQKLLKGRIIKVPDTPNQERIPSSPSTKCRIRRSVAISSERLRASNHISKTETDKYLKKIEEEEHSLQMKRSFSQDSFSTRSTLKRKCSKLLDDLITPEKNQSPTKAPMRHSKSMLTPSKVTMKLFSSPIKSRKTSNSRSNTPNKNKFEPLFNSPFNDSKVSPKKSPKKKQFSIISFMNTSQNNSPIKSLLKNTLISQKANEKSRIPSKVLMSPNIKSRSFISTEPPKNYHEEAMFMDTKEFNSRITRSTFRNSPVKPKYLPHFDNNSRSNNSDTIETFNVTPTKRLKYSS